MRKMMELAAFAALAAANVATATASALPLTALVIAAGALLWPLSGLIDAVTA